METVLEHIIYTKTKDGVSIQQRVFNPMKPNGTAILIASSIMVDQSRYKTFAQFLVSHGYTVVTFDYRGMGDDPFSPQLRQKATLTKWGLFDLDAAILYLKNQFYGYELVVIGHQISGELLGLAQASEFLNRMVLIGSGLSTRHFWPRSKRWFLWFIQLTHPLFSYYPGGNFQFLQRIPKNVIREWSGIFKSSNKFHEVFSKRMRYRYQGPLLAYSFSDDWLTSKDSVKALLDFYPNARIKWEHIEPKFLDIPQIGHLGFFESTEVNQIWHNLLDWLSTPK